MPRQHIYYTKTIIIMKLRCTNLLLNLNHRKVAFFGIYRDSDRNVAISCRFCAPARQCFFFFFINVLP